MSALQRCWRVPAPASRGWTACRWTPSRASISARWTWRTWTNALPRTCWAPCCPTGSSPGSARPARAQGARVQPDARRGWGSRHTIVQVVNDDMPFLVDSVSLEIAPGTGHPPDRASDLRGAARCARRAAVGRAPATMRKTCRADRGCTSRSTAWSMRSSVPRPAASSACWRTCAPRSATGRPWSRACTGRGRSSMGPARRLGGRGTGKPGFPRLAGRRPLHAAGIPAARPGGAGR